MRHSVRLSYDGSAFCGWQIQNNARTVQGELEKALSTLLGEPVSVVGAGRTDTEVNAINYIAHFDVSDNVSINPDQLYYKLNAMLPREIAVHEVSVAGEEFHARFDAKSREYHYFVHFRKDPFCEKFSYRLRYPLDVAAMNEASLFLLGEHDFSCFEKVGGNNTPEHVRLSCCGLWALEHRLSGCGAQLSCPVACGIFPNWGSNLCPLI